MKNRYLIIGVLFALMLICFAFLGIKSTGQPRFHISQASTPSDVKLLAYRESPGQTSTLQIISLPSQTPTDLPFPQEFGRFFFACSYEKKLFSVFEHAVAEWEDNQWKSLVTETNRDIISGGCNDKNNSLEFVLVDDVFASDNQKEEAFQIDLSTRAKQPLASLTADQRNHQFFKDMFSAAGTAYAYDTNKSITLKGGLGKYKIFFTAGDASRDIISGWSMFNAPVEFASWTESDRFIILSIKKSLYLYDVENNTYSPLNFTASQIYEIK